MPRPVVVPAHRYDIAVLHHLVPPYYDGLYITSGLFHQHTSCAGRAPSYVPSGSLTTPRPRSP
eukprot:3013844-Heterocapsa_arctica.AAC.1